MIVLRCCESHTVHVQAPPQTLTQVPKPFGFAAHYTSPHFLVCISVGRRYLCLLPSLPPACTSVAEQQLPTPLRTLCGIQHQNAYVVGAGEGITSVTCCPVTWRITSQPGTLAWEGRGGGVPKMDPFVSISVRDPFYFLGCGLSYI